MMKMLRFTLPIALFLLLLAQSATALEVDCYKCHAADAFKGRVVHAPVRDNNCLGCHGPHVSRHQKLLLQVEKELCLECHQQVAITLAGKPALHAPVRDGLCSSCHEPHAAEQDKLLKKSAGLLCFSCHETNQQNYAVSHSPFAKGQCGSCHAPHGGDDSRLLKEVGSQLCFGCHQQDKALQAKHLGRSLDDTDCLTCHHPHGGDNRLLLRKVSHAPFGERNCQACHGQEPGVASCLECHSEVLASFNFVHNHLGIAGQGNPCVDCHNPHVGDRPLLLPKNVGRTCRSCHAATFALQEKNLHKHSGWNNCLDCHNLHGSNSVAMLKQGQEVCNICHAQHNEFTHPIGDEALDPRNNRPMDCLTCHNGNDGSNYRYFLRGSGERGLCVQCHQGY